MPLDPTLFVAALSFRCRAVVPGTSPDWSMPSSSLPWIEGPRPLHGLHRIACDETALDDDPSSSQGRCMANEAAVPVLLAPTAPWREAHEASCRPRVFQ